MPKILYLVTEDWFFASHFLPMAQAAQDCGYQVAVATRVREDGERLKANGISVIPIESKRGSFSPLVVVRDFVRLLAILRAERPDVVRCISLQPIVIGGLAAKLAGVGKLVVPPTGLGHLWLDRGLSARIARNIVRRVVRVVAAWSADALLFENHDDPREFGRDPDGADVTIVGGAGGDPTLPPHPDCPLWDKARRLVIEQDLAEIPGN